MATFMVTGTRRLVEYQYVSIEVEADSIEAAIAKIVSKDEYDELDWSTEEEEIDDPLFEADAFDEVE